jgi:hypothetical protein
MQIALYAVPAIAIGYLTIKGSIRTLDELFRYFADRNGY